MAIAKELPVVDVIIPTYNGLPFLEATVQSVLGQTYKNLELYVVDDGSTDHGATRRYITSVKDKRLHYLKKTNGGQATARNFGIKNSSSPLIAFLDADDIWYPEKLEKQVALMEKNSQVGLVYGHHYIIDEDDIIQGNLRHWKRGKIFNDLCGGNLIAGSASMALVRRNVIDDVGLFHEDFLIGEDWEMWLRIAYKYEVDFVPIIIAALRQHTNSMQKNSKKMSDGLVYMLGIMEKEFALTRPQRRVMAAYCLYHAAVGYQAAGYRGLARKTFLRLFTEDPRRFFEFDHWKLHLGFGIYTRVIFGNPLFDLLHYIYRRLLRAAYIGVRAIYRFTLKPLLK